MCNEPPQKVLGDQYSQSRINFVQFNCVPSNEKKTQEKDENEYCNNCNNPSVLASIMKT